MLEEEPEDQLIDIASEVASGDQTPAVVPAHDMSWSCAQCTLTNHLSDLTCVACQSAQPTGALPACNHDADATTPCMCVCVCVLGREGGGCALDFMFGLDVLFVSFRLRLNQHVSRATCHPLQHGGPVLPAH